MKLFLSNEGDRHKKRAIIMTALNKYFYQLILDLLPRGEVAKTYNIHRAILF